MRSQHQSITSVATALALGLIAILSFVPGHLQAQTTCNADFYANQITGTTKAGFIDSSTATSNPNADHTWYYGNGQKDTGTNLNFSQHDFGSYGQFSVCHVIKDGNCYDSTCQQVTISCDSSANFSYKINNQTVSFRSSSGRLADSIIWDFGDGNTKSGLSPDHTYASTGSYTVTLKVIKTANPRCVGTTQRTVTITQTGPCNVDAGFRASGRGYQWTFNATDPTIASHKWNFGDGSTRTGASVSHTYRKKDTYDVTLIVRDTTGNCADTNTKRLIIEDDNVITGELDLQQGQTRSSDSLKVELYRYDSCKGVYNQVQTELALTGRDSALYQFNGLAAGKYYIKADPGNNARLSSYVATYHRQASKWGNADSIILQGISNNNLGNDITLLKATNSNGTGNITGYVGGSKANCTNKRRPEDGPLANVPVLLLNENREPVARTTTDEDGNYQFSDLGLTTYYVRVDLPGYQARAEEVTLSSDQAEQEADFEVSDEQVTPQESTGFSEKADSGPSVALYPVPARSQVNVAVSGAEAEQLSLQVTDMKGRVLTQQRLSTGGQQQDVQLDVSSWQSGAYILQLRDQHGQVKEARKLMVR